jgi:hypothetical protein
MAGDRQSSALFRRLREMPLETQREAMERVFAKFAAWYGSQLTRSYGDSMEVAREVWREDLSDLTLGEIKKGLEECKSEKFLPSLPAFRLLCRPSSRAPEHQEYVALPHQRADPELVKRVAETVRSMAMAGPDADLLWWRVLAKEGASYHAKESATQVLTKKYGAKAVLHYLETGEFPDVSDGRRSDKSNAVDGGQRVSDSEGGSGGGIPARVPQEPEGDADGKKRQGKRVRR